MLLLEITRTRDGDSGAVLSAWLAQSWLQRLRGLLGRPELPVDTGLLLMPCKSVHTVGMRHPIDVVFLDAQGTVIRTQESLRPMRCAGAHRASCVLELRAGRLRDGLLRVGDRLQWAVASQATRPDPRSRAKPANDEGAALCAAKSQTNGES